MIWPFAILAIAAALDTPRIQALAIPPNNAVRVNGELGEEVWRMAQPVDAFVQREPD